MAGSPKSRKVSFRLLLMIGTMCLYMPIFIYINRLQHVHLDEIGQILKQEKSVDKAINTMPYDQRVNSLEYKSLSAQREALWTRSNAAFTANSHLGWLDQYFLWSYLAILFGSLGYLINTSLKEGEALPS